MNAKLIYCFECPRCFATVSAWRAHDLLVHQILPPKRHLRFG